jgi:hypothetical protein
MTRDVTAEIDRLGRQLAVLRTSLIGQAGDAADEAATYIAPRARHLAKQVQREGYLLGKAASHNPSAATGALLGAMALGAALVWLLSGSGGADRN